MRARQGGDRIVEMAGEAVDERGDGYRRVGASVARQTASVARSTKGKVGLVEFITDIAQDASQEPGYQAQPLYVLLNIGLPFAVGMLVSATRRIWEYVSEQNRNGDSAEVAE